MKRILSVLLALILLFGVLPLTAFAQEANADNGSRPSLDEFVETDAEDPQELAATGATSVTYVSLTVNAPVAGQPATYFVDTESNSAKYYVGSYNYGSWKNSVQWYDVTNNTAISADNTSFRFVQGRQYKVSVDIWSNSGYEFAAASSITVSINGKVGKAEEWGGSVNAKSNLKAVYTFTCKAATTVSTIYVKEVHEPIAGEAPYYSNWKTDSTGCKRLTTYNYGYRFGIKWRDVTAFTDIDPNDSSYRFIAGHQYQFSCVVRADTVNGYVFAKSLYPYINDVRCELDDWDTADNDAMVVVKRTFTCVSPISTVEFTGVDEPYPDQAPRYAATLKHAKDIDFDSSFNSDGYRYGIAWLNEDGSAVTGNFIDGRTYRFRVAIKAKSGYVFTSSTKATVNGYSATVGTWNNVTADKRWIEKTFYCMRNQISQFDLSVTEPKAGSYPDYYPKIKTENAKYEVDNYTGGAIFKGVVWSESKGGPFFDEKFEAGNTYTVSIFLVPVDPVKYEFQTSGLSAKVNGNTAQVSTVTAKTRIAVQYTFTVKTTKTIKEVSVTVTEPKAGNTPSYAATVPSGKGYQVEDYNSSVYYTGVRWYNETDQVYVSPNSGTTFVGGKRYTCRVSLISEDYYVFSDAASLLNATVNGNNATSFDNYSVGKNIWIEYTFTVPEEINDIAVFIEEPKSGNYPSYHATTPDSDDLLYVVEDYNVRNFENGVKWVDETTGIVMQNNFLFDPGKEYSVTIYFDAKYPDRNTFATAGRRATINGRETTFYGSATDAYIKYTFTCPSSGSGYTVSGKATSFINTADVTTIQLVQNGSVKYSTSVTGNENRPYSIPNVANGSYTLRVSKKNHVTRDYAVTVSGSLTQDVKICPIGDADNNGRVNSADAKAAFQHGNEQKPITDEYKFKCADVAKPYNRINSSDAKAIFQHANEQKSLWED